MKKKGKNKRITSKGNQKNKAREQQEENFKDELQEKRLGATVGHNDSAIEGQKQNCMCEARQVDANKVQVVLNGKNCKD